MKREGYTDVLVARRVRQGRVSRGNAVSVRTKWDLYLECGHTVRRTNKEPCKTVKCERCRVGFSRDWNKKPKNPWEYLPKKSEFGVYILKKVK